MTDIASGHLFQTSQWSEFQKALGNEVINRQGEGWHYLAIIESGSGPAGKHFKRLYTPYGPSFNNQQAFEQALLDLTGQAKNLNCDYIRIEPINLVGQQLDIKKTGFKKTKHNFQPTLTLIIDLQRPFDDILKDMSKTNRYLWKKSSENHITFATHYETDKLSEFLHMISATSKRTSAAFKDGYYYQQLLNALGPKKQAGIAYAAVNDEILVGALFVDDIAAKTRYYLFAGSFDKARQYSANSPLLTYLIHSAHSQDFKKFDLFGISPIEDVNHRWAGLSKFKRSFGGQEVKYCGTYEKPIKPLKYHLMSTVRRFAR